MEQQLFASASFLLSKQNPDGGFGSSPSTVYESALAIEALAAAGELNSQRIQAGLMGLQYLGNQQQENGSWEGDAFSTAIALKALSYAKPDLSIQTGDIRLSTTSPLEGETIALTATVRNLGLEPVATAIVRLLDGDTLIAEQTVSNLAPGASTEVPFTLALAASGEHNLKIVLDPDGALPELREENNTGSFRLWAAGRPDLILLPEFFTFTPASPRPGEPVTLTVWIANLGETAVPQASADLYDGDPAAGGVKLGSLTLYGLAAGGWGEGSLTFSLADTGEHTLTLVADPQGAVTEQDESNNVAVRALTVSPASAAGPVDLLIPVDGLRLDPARPRSGESVTVTVQALNLGMEPAEAELELFDGDPLAGGVLLHRQALTLSPGQTATVQFPWQGEGVHTLHAFIDRAGRVAEIDETNNRAELPVMFGMVDIEVSASDLAIEPGQPMAGDAATVAVTIHNRGIQSTGPFSVKLYNGAPDSGGTLLETFAVADLAGDGSATLTHAFTAERGDYRFYAVCDPGGQVTELFEGNNTAIRSLSVKTSEEALGPDLVPIELVLTGTTQNPQSLRIEGTALVKVQNKGDDKVGDPYRVTVFEDRDGDGLYSEGKDKILGSWEYPLPMWPNGVALAPVAVSGTLTFRDAPIYVAIDTEQAVFEQNEENNTIRRGSECEARPAKPIEPVLKWKWPRTTDSTFGRILSMPVVISLTDDNGDGRIDDRDTPSVLVNVLVAYPALEGKLWAIKGDTGNLAFSRYTAGQAPYEGGYPIAGDIDSDGKPEIIIVKRSVGTGIGILAFAHDGTLKWDNTSQIKSWQSANPFNIPNISEGDLPVLADLDGDGHSEIIDGRTIFNWDGSVRCTPDFRLAGGMGITNGVGGYSISVADLDMDGKQEIIGGYTAYNNDCTIKWYNTTLPDGLTAIGNLDEDPYPEIALMNSSGPGGPRLYLLDHNGTVKWGPIFISRIEGSTSWPPGSHPLITDFDGDGKPEIGVRGYQKYYIFDRNGQVKTTLDLPNGNVWNDIAVAPAVFDLDGDGRPEVLLNSAGNFKVFDGKEGKLLYQESNGIYSYYSSQNVLIADVDGDGHAEAVVTGNNGYGGNSGNLRVYGAKNNDWVGARKIWNEPAYHVTNVNDDGTIPRYEAPSWLLNNSYRVNVPEGTASVENPYLAADLSASYVRVTMADFPASVSLTVRVGNGGAKATAAGVPVAFYDGDPQAGGVMIGAAATNRDLLPGEYEDVTLVWNAPAEGRHALIIRANSDGSMEECDEANNETVLDITLTSGGITQGGLPDLAIAQEDLVLPDGAPEGRLIDVGLTVRNPGAETAENGVLRLFVGDPARGGRQIGDDRLIAHLGAGEATMVTIPWNTLGYLGTNYLYAVIDPDSSIAEANEGNNTALKAVAIAAALKPDLQIDPEGITVSPSAPAEGDLLAVSVTVHNRGTALGEVKVVLYDGDPAAGGAALGAAVIDPLIPFGGSASVTISLESIGLSGSRTLWVALDPDDLIAEADETNNRASRQITVAPTRLGLTLNTDKPAYRANETAQVLLHVTELGSAGRALTYDLRLLDQSGHTVATVAAGVAFQLGAGATLELPVQWNTGATLSGEYLLVAALKEGGREVARASAPLSILADKTVKVSVTTDKVAYGANETAALVAAITSESPNYLFSGLTSRLSIVDPQGAEVFSSSRTVPLLTPGQSTPVNAYWNTANAPRGAYTVRLELFGAETPLGQAQAVFEVLGSAATGAGILGTLAVEPAVIEYGKTGQLLFTVTNHGNEELSGHALLLLLVDPDSKETVTTVRIPAQQALPTAGTQAGEWTLETAGLGLKNYLAVLQLEIGELRQTLSGSAFRVKDETPPTLAVTSPVAGETCRLAVPIAAQASDLASGIERVEYRLDEGDWRPLLPGDPASGVYAALWEPTLADDGDHTVVLRAIDRAGNETVSPAIAFRVQMDSDPPVTQLTIGEPAFPTSAGATYVTRATVFTFSATDDLSGVQAIYYRFDDEPQWRLYNGTFRLDDLGFGAHVLRFQSVDNVGNTEEEQAAAVTLFAVEVATEMLNPPRVLVWTGDPDRIGGKERPPYTLKDVRALFAEALSEPDAYVTLMTEKDAFQEAFRSGLYNVAMVLDQDTPFDANFLREMREAVHGGMGMLVSSWKNSVHPILQDLFGVDFQGSLTMNEEERSLRLFESPLAVEQTLTVRGRVLRTHLAGGTLAGILPGESACGAVRSLALRYPVQIFPGDRLTATLSAPQGNKLVTVDEEHATVTTLPVGAVNGSLGNTNGDLAITETAADGLILVLAAPYGELAASYTLAVTIERADGSRIASAPATLTPICDSHLAAGMKIGSFEVSQVEENRVKSGDDLPAVVLGSYGVGRTVFLAYDLVGSALAGDRGAHSALLRNAATWLLNEETGAKAGGISLLQTRLQALGAEVDLKTVDTLGEGLIHLPIFGLTRQPLEYTFHLSDGEEGNYRYFLRIPDAEGEYNKTTEVSLEVNGGSVLFNRYPFRFTVETNSQARTE